MNSKRVREYDIMRGIGIMTIMIYHLVYRPINSVADFIICMVGAAFIVESFIISALVYNPDKRSIKDEYINKTKELLIPAVGLATGLCIVGGIYCMLFHNYTLKVWFKNVVYTFLRPEISNKILPTTGENDYLYFVISPIWFIWTMIWTFVVFIPLAKWFRHNIKRELISLVISIVLAILLYSYFPISPWSITHVPTYLAIMIITRIVKEQKIIEKILNMNIVFSVVTAIAAIGVQVLLYYQFGTDQMYNGILGKGGNELFNNSQIVFLDIYKQGINFTSVWYEPLTYILTGFVGFYVMVSLSRYINNVKGLSSAFEWIGQRTLSFLLMHAFFAFVMTDVLHTYFKMGYYWFIETSPAPDKVFTAELFWKSFVGFVGAIALISLYCVLKEKVTGKKK